MQPLFIKSLTLQLLWTWSTSKERTGQHDCCCWSWSNRWWNVRAYLKSTEHSVHFTVGSNPGFVPCISPSIKLSIFSYLAICYDRLPLLSTIYQASWKAPESWGNSADTCQTRATNWLWEVPFLQTPALIATPITWSGLQSWEVQARM